MKKIIITGSSGLVGAECVKFFTKKNFKVIGIDNNMRKFFFGKSGSIHKNTIEFKKNSSYEHHNIDIRDHKKVEKIFKNNSKDIYAIIHAAAQPSHDWAYQNPLLDFDINARSTLTLLNYFKKYCKKSSFIFVSTNKVYGDNPNKIKLKSINGRYYPKNKNHYAKGFNEELSTDKCLHSFFGTSKLYADIIVQEYGKNFNLNTVCFRAGCITGPMHAGAELHGFLSYLVKSTIKKEKYNIFGFNGNQVRDNIHSSDLVNCFWNYLKSPTKGEVYNIGGGLKNSISINEALKYIESKLNIKIKKKYFSKSRSGDHAWYITDYSKFKKKYPNWIQKYSIKKILNELINLYN